MSKVKDLAHTVKTGLKSISMKIKDLAQILKVPPEINTWV
jgi:hypothetical protein